jgi:antitoxin component YwqK of YwqJK toxin-antitoxin module
MHRLQLIVILALAVLAVLYVSVGPIRLVPIHSAGLALAPYGYSYVGKPFTGVVYERGSGYHLLMFTTVYKGLRHGPDIQWYASGNRFIERHYYYGRATGVHKAWFENGRIRSFKTYRNGEPDGEFYEWHSNGQLAQFILYRQGKEVAAKSWTAGGKPFYNYVWNEGRPVGLQGDAFCSPRKRKL